MTTIRDRLNILSNSYKSARQFAISVGVAPQTLDNYLKGRPVPVDFVVNVWRQTKCDLHWLITGETKAKYETETESTSSVVAFKQEQFSVSLRDDQKKLLAAWEKIDCKKRGAIMTILKSMEG